jgi:hypothetical protein
MKAGLVLDLVSAVFALGAAGFWFWSGVGKLPPMLMYFDGAPPDDPFYKAFVRSVRRNRWAAICAGVSALAMGASLLVSVIV